MSALQPRRQKESTPTALVFRDAVTCRPRANLERDLRNTLAAAASVVGASQRRARLQEALLCAGALECALEDAGSPAGTVATITDQVAAASFAPDSVPVPVLPEALVATEPTELRLSRPEGFAYYALSPMVFAAAIAATADVPDIVTVVGIRTIGTTLGAAAMAALRARGRRVERFTLRPTGHPYDRRVALDANTHVRVRRSLAAGAHFIVVDEGPGLSGSSFLAVAEALQTLGVPVSRIRLVGTRVPDPTRLLAPNATVRWRRFRFVAAPAERTPTDVGRDLSGGSWRERHWSSPRQWPAVWPAMERRKFLSRDGRCWLKFEGLGGHGADAYQRAQVLGEAGWTPAPCAPPDQGGFIVYPALEGSPIMRRPTIDAEFLYALGAYADARARLFTCRLEDRAQAALEEMVRHNVAQETGFVLGHEWSLPCERPALVDGRVGPPEWFRSPQGRFIKVDAIAHGDDHFFPGPTDIAWDLAGAIIEWDLGADARDALLRAYRRMAGGGDDPAIRLSRYELAYAAFRAGFCAMAAHAAPEDDARRFQHARARYRRALLDRLRDHSSSLER